MIAIGCDHAGYLLKEEVRRFLEEQGVEYRDYGSYEGEPCDYPVVAQKVCNAIVSGQARLGLLFCGTGVGISMAANKVRGIRAACCENVYSAKYTRLHNDANVLCMGGRVIGPGLACEMVKAFLNAEFEGGRHQRRVSQIMEIEAGKLLDSGC